jgi:hypothetical protein
MTGSITNHITHWSLAMPNQERALKLDFDTSWGLSDNRRLLRVHDFGDKGRGVVAAEDIRMGELIERAPVLIIPDIDRRRVDGSIVFTYVFMWENGTVEEDLYQHTGRSAIALGYISLLNHSYAPNADFIRHIDAGYIDLVARKDIRTGQEILIDYQMTLWFDPN